MWVIHVRVRHVDYDMVLRNNTSMIRMFAVVLIIGVITIDYYNHNNYGSDPVGLYQGAFA